MQGPSASRLLWDGDIPCLKADHFLLHERTGVSVNVLASRLGPGQDIFALIHRIVNLQG